MLGLTSRLLRVNYVVLALLLSAPVTWAQSQPGFLSPLIDQKLLLLHVGDQEKVKVKKKDLQKLKGTCDMAVQLKLAEWDRGTARFGFENIGIPTNWIANAPRRSSCKMDYGHVVLEITGFSQNESPQAVEAALRQILLTPEQYMEVAGIRFDLPPSQDNELAVQCRPPIIPVKALFSVDPEFSDQARQAKYQGVLKVRMIVGSDGRIHKPQIIAPLGMGLEQTTLEALPMWRFQPATQSGKPVACETTIEVSFNLY